jgi:hypothetical protein
VSIGSARAAPLPLTASATIGALVDPADFSLASLRDPLLSCLDVVAPGSVMEVGAFQGLFTAVLIEWAQGSGARVTAVEPEPPQELLTLAARHPELELVRERSFEALSGRPLADVVIIDGDHNYYTVSEELRLIAKRAEGEALPLIAFHDVAWPHARRDTYYAPERIPEQHRQPLARDALVAPGEPGLARAGLQFPWAASREGGPANGVLTAIEDFIAGREGLQLALVPAFFGLGLLWEQAAPWAGPVADLIAPWDRNPLLERLEADRLAHIVDRHRLDHQSALLRALLNSRAFAVAEALSRVRQRGDPVVSSAQIRRLLGDE